MSGFKRLIHEIHRRSLWQVLGIYVVAGWLVLQAVDTLASALSLPEWASPLALFLLIVGLPIVLATAFVQEGIGSSGGSKDTESQLGGESSAPATGGVLSRLTWRRALLGGVVAFSLLIGAAGLFVILGDHETVDPAPGPADAADPAIAVLPFTVRGQDLEMWAEGMVDLLSPMVDGVAGLRAINNRTVLARWRERVGRGEADLETALEVARAAGASYALIGSVVASGETTRIDLDLYDTTSGERLARQQVEGQSDDFLGLTDQAAAETVRAVLESQGRIPNFDLDRLTDSPDALRAFLEGEVAFRSYRLVDAWDAYSEAIAHDSAFAFAHLRLPELAQWGATARRETDHHLEAAGRHRDRLNERAAFRVQAQLAPAAERVEMYRDGVARYPDDATLWYVLGEALLHGSDGLPRVEEIEPAFRRSIELEPNRASFYPHVVGLAFEAGSDTARVRELVRHFAGLAADLEGPYTIDLDPRVGPFVVDLTYGTEAEQAAARAAADTLPPGFLVSAGSYTYTPRLWEAFELVNLAALNHEQAGSVGVFGTGPTGGTVRATAARRLIIGYALWRGQLQRGLEFLADASLGLDPFVTSESRGLLYYLHAIGLPVPDELLDDGFGTARIDSTSIDEVVFLAGALAADQGRWEDHQRAIAELERTGASTRGVQALEAYGAWRRGDVAAAISGFERTHNGIRLVQWWLGDAYREAGRWEEAERVFRSYGWNQWFAPFTQEPLAQQRLGTIYEALGRPDEAAVAYAYFLEHWEHADSELQPLVAETRRRLEEILVERG